MKHRTLAISGNPNSGKTTLFNRLTGANQHVGNWPGVTVDRKTGVFTHAGCTVDLIDLPGIYSLSPYTQEEIVAREFILSDEPQGIVNIVDAVHIERNLYLTMQLIARGLPMVIALNFADDCRAQDIQIDCAALSQALGVRVIAISARHGENMQELLDALTGDMQPPVRQPVYRRGVSAAIRRVSDLLSPLPLRQESLPFYALKLLEGDPHVQQTLALPDDICKKIDQIISGLQHQAGSDDSQMILAGAIYDFIESVISKGYIRPRHAPQTITARIDRVVMHKWFSLPIFALLMALMFAATFGPVGSFFMNLLDELILGRLSPLTEDLLLHLHASDWMIGLVCDGIIGGVGGVISFLPQIIILFFFLSILEDTGYLARIAFIMDTLLRKIGLSGKSFVPMLMGFGCTTPAVMAARTMENEKDRRMTIMLTPFMSCGAKLPVYALFAGVFFPRYAALVTISLYLLGMIMAILAGFLLRHTIFRGISSGFVLELPTYRLPTFKGTVQNLLTRAKDFLTKAGTVIFLMSIVIWVLQNFTPAFTAAQHSADSILGQLGILLAPLFAPLGFGFWEAAVSLLAGLVAKEAVVSTMNVLFATGGDSGMLFHALSGSFTPLSAYSFLVFTLLYVPCLSAFATIKREMGGWRWAVGSAAFQTGLAWLAAFAIYQVGSLFV